MMEQTLRCNFDDIISCPSLEEISDIQAVEEHVPLILNSRNDEGLEHEDTLDETATRDGGESCVFCRDKEQVQRIGQIQMGDHIEMPRPQFLAKLFGFWIYSHFAFVANVEENPEFPGDDTKVRLTLIESMPTKPNIRKRVVDFDLKKDYFLVHRYKQPVFSPSHSKQRAEEMLRRYKEWEEGLTTGEREVGTTWNLFTNNCEDFVTWVKTGVSISSQVQDKADTGASFFSTVISKILNIIKEISKPISNIVDDIAPLGRVVGSASKSVSPLQIVAYVFIPLTIIVAALIAVYDVHKYYKLRQKKKVCECCYRQKLTKVLVMLFVALVFVVVGTLASEFGGPIVAVVMAVIGIIGYGLLTNFFNKIYYFVKSCFPSWNIQSTKLNDTTEVNPGDAITFKYCGLPHEGIVTNITSDGLTVIHYAWVTLFGREIIEEVIKLDNSIRIHDYTGVDTFPREEVVQKARSRKGEKRFNTFTNRSSHFVAWCKVKKAECEQSSSLNDWREVFVWNEVECGCVIQFWMYGRKHSAILVGIDKGMKHMQIIHYGHRDSVFSRRIVKDESVAMDLKVNSFWVRSFAHYNCYGLREVLDRARESINRTDFSNSISFCLYCTVK